MTGNANAMGDGGYLSEMFQGHCANLTTRGGKLMRLMLLGCAILCTLSSAAAQAQPPEELEIDETPSFELCDTCKSESDFIEYARYKASERSGEYSMWVGNSSDGNLYRMEVVTRGAVDSARGIQVEILSADRQNEATREHFRNIIRVVRE